MASTPASSSATELLELQPQSPLSFDNFIHVLQQHGVALIDLRANYNVTIPNSNNHDENSIDDLQNGDDHHHNYSHNRQNRHGDTNPNIPSTVFATARYTLDQLHRQQQQQQSPLVYNEQILIETSSSSSPPMNTNTMTTYLECPMIASNNVNHNSNNTNKTHSAAHVFGYHPTGGSISTRYNMHREGFVFSDRHVTFDVVLQTASPPPLPNKTTSIHSSVTTTITSFGNDCYQMFTLLHNIADIVLSNIGHHLQLPNTNRINNYGNDYIQEHFGPTIHYSQWHLKRYTYNHDPHPSTSQTPGRHQQEPVILLPSHTDPSLISIVLLDRPHIQSGAMGLQYFQRSSNNNNQNNNTKERAGEWVEIPYSGHDVAIVFVGSILQYITNGYFTAVKHRVVYNNENDDSGIHPHDGSVPLPLIRQQRMAATLFCRPKPSALLETVPSPLLNHDPTSLVRPIITFEEWMDKTAKNYEKAKAG